MRIIAIVGLLALTMSWVSCGRSDEATPLPSDRRDLELSDWIEIEIDAFPQKLASPPVRISGTINSGRGMSDIEYVATRIIRTSDGKYWRSNTGRWESDSPKKWAKVSALNNDGTWSMDISAVKFGSDSYTIWARTVSKSRGAGATTLLSLPKDERLYREAPLDVVWGG